MRFRLFLSPLCAVLLGSCAYQGTIVQKDTTPLPFEHSYGLDGSYAFLLRDSTGSLRRQIVTAEVYNEYAIGEYFNDLQPRRASDGKTYDGKTVMTAMMSKVTTSRPAVTAQKSEQKRQIAKTTTAKKSGVKIAKQSSPAAKQQPQPAAARIVAAPAPAPQPRKALPAAPTIELPSQILRARPVWDTEVAFVSAPVRCR
jgi:hypothetical protein